MCALNGLKTQAKVLQITNLIEIRSIAMRWMPFQFFATETFYMKINLKNKLFRFRKEIELCIRVQFWEWYGLLGSV